jgi:hypothetical protein
MENLKEFLINSIKKIWEGFLHNLGIVIPMFVVSGGYLVAINEIRTYIHYLIKV